VNEVREIRDCRAQALDSERIDTANRGDHRARRVTAVAGMQKPANARWFWSLS
jgi:hypothetical protein